MRFLRLLGTAAQAEGLLLRRQSASMGRSAMFGAAAAGFAVAMLVLLHVAGWIWVKEHYGALAAALVLALVDGVIALALLLLARGQHDPVAKEAMALRDQSLSLLVAPASQRPPWESLALDLGGLVVQYLRSRRG